MAYDVILYCGKKSAAGPVVMWEMNCGGMFLTASDDYFIISDSYGFLGEETMPGWEELGQAGRTFWLSLDVMKALEKDLRDWPAEEVIIDLDDGIHFGGVEYGTFEEVDEEAWDHARCILGMHDFIESDHGRVLFAVHPDRLRKLSLVKPGDFPIDCRYGFNTRYGRDVIHFKIGPTVRGVFAPLDREILIETLPKEVLW